MRNLIKIIGIILIVLPCYSQENSVGINNVDRLISEENRIKIDNYLSNELLNGISISEQYLFDKNVVIDFYGIPLEETEETTEAGNGFRLSFGLIAERKLIYDDLIHIYFIFDHDQYYGNITSRELLQRIEINRPLERLKTINIGDNANKIREEFGNILTDRKYEIIFRLKYNRRYPFDLVFLIENDIIIKIVCTYFYLE